LHTKPDYLEALEQLLRFERRSRVAGVQKKQEVRMAIYLIPERPLPTGARNGRRHPVPGTSTRNGDSFNVARKTHGEIEAAICEGITRLEQEYMGRGPKEIRAHLIGDLLLVRLHGVLTPAEQQLVKSDSAEKGRDLLKQVRSHLIETARLLLDAMVQEITGVKVLSLHHDISTVTGEEVVLFTLAETPYFPR
jgi:uncharacterized protein YbcI